MIKVMNIVVQEDFEDENREYKKGESYTGYIGKRGLVIDYGNHGELLDITYLKGYGAEYMNKFEIRNEKEVKNRKELNKYLALEIMYLKGMNVYGARTGRFTVDAENISGTPVMGSSARQDFT